MVGAQPAGSGLGGVGEVLQGLAGQQGGPLQPHCSLTVNSFDGGRRFVSGNRCSRPLGEEPSRLPDLMRPISCSKARSTASL